MKTFYLKTAISIAVIFALVIPLDVWAQCNCGGNSTAQQVQYSVYKQTSSDSTRFIFPQFDASLGNLSCVELDINVISRVRIRLENEEEFPVNYLISYSKGTNFEGEGISGTLTGNFSKNYGPYYLLEGDGNFFSGPDFIQTDFDTMINTNINRVIKGNVVPFLGNDSVSYVYYISVSSLISGSGNYLGGPQTIDQVWFTLTYYYCIPGVLDKDFKDFSVSSSNNIANLNWTIASEKPNSEYIIEISYDNKQFFQAGKISGSNASIGAEANYQYQYHLNQASSSTVYFRIGRKTADGAIVYSVVKMVRNEHPSGNITTYPNPSRGTFSLHIPGNGAGNYFLEIYNSAGSLVYKDRIRTDTKNLADIHPASVFPEGLYMIRARKEDEPAVFTGKLFIKH